MFEIYCDESRPEAIYSRKVKSNHERYMVIGGIWIEKEERKKVKNKLEFLKKKNKISAEFKWTKVSPSKIDFYKEVVEYFFSNPKIRFRCIVVDSEKIDMELFHESDSELGFYKFYYQLLIKWIDGNTSYRIYLDDKANKQNSRLSDLQYFLSKSSFGDIDSVLALPSSDSVFIQLADLLIGAVSSVFNQSITSPAKKEIVGLIENIIDNKIEPTTSSEKKFNIFKIILR